ncbi:MAG: 3D-(3,5/4)-trihydroxycyclohexane-1,2-dione acylhydrolase (decyclizing) [Alphaproteobacteria bacterium]|nr:3D-(3,5/4)-trihydroxycyclohexane-1,2-dione acylhydrolase (decyclizing) [Alphaproteobacteria bacterium]
MPLKTMRLTMAQALCKYLINQFTVVDGKQVPLFPGIFGIFGHGNVTCLSEALYEVRDQLPMYRGLNEQSMALAAIGFAKAKRRQQIMVATSSIGPGATNMVTAAGLAHANRLPILILSGDIFINRRPDPVLQQVEHYNNPTISVNDAFKPVTRYWDRIVHPEQIISSLPQAVAAMLDPADCGPAFIGLPQDIQEYAFDYPAEFFEPTIHEAPRPRADMKKLAQAVALLKAAKRPLIISGGGVRYSGAEATVAAFALEHGIPLSETVAGKSGVVHDHKAHIGPIGIIGSASANAMAAEADVILAIGTRLQDFTTGSWTVFDHKAKFISINAARWDATKHRALSVVGDAKATVEELAVAMKGHKAPAAWMEKGHAEFADWNKSLDGWQAPTNAPIPTYGQVVGVVNRKAATRDYMITAAGGLPGETMKNWRVKSANSFDCEFGFSCMGYEIAGGWGAAIADPTRDVFVMVGDGSYMMMNSDIYNSVLFGHKMIVIVCDNGGYAVINRLQNFKGAASYNNLIKDSLAKNPFPVDFVKHAEAMGAHARKVESLSELETAIDWAKGNDKTTVITIVSDAFVWTPGDALWDVGVPTISNRKQVNDARKYQDDVRAKQRIGV